MPELFFSSNRSSIFKSKDSCNFEPFQRESCNDYFLDAKWSRLTPIRSANSCWGSLTVDFKLVIRLLSPSCCPSTFQIHEYEIERKQDQHPCYYKRYLLESTAPSRSLKAKAKVNRTTILLANAVMAALGRYAQKQLICLLICFS